MSLIEEALRKQEQEEGPRPTVAVPAPAPTVRPVAAPPLPEPPAARPSHTFNLPPDRASPIIARPVHPEFGRPQNRVLGAIIGLFLVLLMLAGFVFLMPANTNRLATVPVAVAGPAQTNISTVPLVVPPATQAAPIQVQVATLDDLVKSAAVAQVASVVSNWMAATIIATGHETVVAATSSVITPPPPPVVVWPEIVIKGMFTAGGKTQVLLGDGNTLELGATLASGVRLLDAGPGWARVSFNGETRTYHRNGGSFTVDARP